MNNRIEQLKTFLQQNANDSFLKHALALEFLKINELKKAQQCFEEIIQYEPNYVGTYYHLAKLYEQLNDRPRAQKTYEQGMQEAKNLKQQHAYNELQAAYEDFLDN